MLFSSISEKSQFDHYYFFKNTRLFYALNNKNSLMLFCKKKCKLYFKRHMPIFNSWKLLHNMLGKYVIEIKGYCRAIPSRYSLPLQWLAEC